MKKLIITTFILLSASYTFAQKKNQLTSPAKVSQSQLKSIDASQLNAVPADQIQKIIRESNLKEPVAKDNGVDGYNQTPGGVYFKYINKSTSNKSAKVGDHASLRLTHRVGDSIIFNTDKINNNEPVVEILKEPQFSGDVMEGILLMHPGDHVIFKVETERLISALGNQMPQFAKDAKYLSWEVKMDDLKTIEEVNKDKDKLKIEEDTKIVNHLKSIKAKYTKTDNGVYIVTKTKGKGVKPENGQVVSVNYNGRLMNGKMFDSNIDPAFNHVTPLEFNLGTGRVIKGWDEGIANMVVGDVVTLYIPSHLAYGSQSKGNDIPANSILVFDVELLSAR